jgi:chloramphenicol-sensitive protein RarD
MASESEAQKLKTGSLYAVLAYLGWGFFPIYWKLLKHIPYLEILCHRVVWAFVFYTIVLIYKEKKFYIFRPKGKKLILNLVFGSILLMSNWLVYIYAVNSNQIVESSLGYFINPLVNIAFGVLFLSERLNLNQKIATLLAMIGVGIITYAQGHIPIIAMFLAVSFSIYGLIKKTNPVLPLESNQFESGILLPFALVFLFMQPSEWIHQESRYVSMFLLLASGVVTGLPLIFFAIAAQKVPYYLMGFFQFLAPSIQFMSGVFIFKEPLTLLQLYGFIFIWSAGLLLIISSWWQHRKKVTILSP